MIILFLILQRTTSYCDEELCLMNCNTEEVGKAIPRRVHKSLKIRNCKETI